MDEGNIPPPPPLTRDGWPFPARMDGSTCTGCRFPIAVGERIVRMSDGTYRHVDACEKIRRPA
jgi:hypothetical protein